MKILAIILFVMLLANCQKSHEPNVDKNHQESSEEDNQKQLDKIDKKNEESLESLKVLIQDDLPKWTKKAGIVNLKNKEIGKNEIEIRIWNHLASMVYPKVFVYNRKGEMRSAMFIQFGFSEVERKKRFLKLDSPKSGWGNFDNYLKKELQVDENMNFSQKGERDGGFDSADIFIEVKTNSVYKTEEFLYPSTAFDGLKFNDFYKKINDEFDISKKSGIQISNE